MNKNTKKSLLYIIILAVITVTAVILKSIAALTDLEENLIYYGDSPLLLASNIIAISGVVLMISFAFTLKKDAIRVSFTSSLSYIPTGVIAVSLALFALAMFSEHTRLSELAIISPSSLPSSYLALATGLLAVASIVHFFLNAFLPERHTRLRSYFAIGTILLLAVYAAFLYFNTSEPINSVNKITEQMAYLFAALFFLYETRISLGRELWRPYFAFGSSAALLTAFASVPAFITYFATGRLLCHSIESVTLLFAMFIFIGAKLILAATAYEDSESPEMSVLREYAEARQNALDNRTVEDGTQISIEELIDIPAMREETDDESEDGSDAEGEPEETEGEKAESDDASELFEPDLFAAAETTETQNKD